VSKKPVLRASQSIALTIAEGNGKTAKADRRRYFEIARGSALECAAIQDVLVVGLGLDKAESRKSIALLLISSYHILHMSNPRVFLNFRSLCKYLSLVELSIF